MIKYSEKNLCNRLQSLIYFINLLKENIYIFLKTIQCITHFTNAFD